MPYKNKDKQKEYQREWKAARRAEYLDGKVCSNCGLDSNLHIHHRDASIKIDHKIWSWSAERRLAELEKCVVLCEGCHREHHKPSHGDKSASRYRSGCRCDLCRAAQTARVRAWKEQRNSPG